MGVKMDEHYDTFRLKTGTIEFIFDPYLILVDSLSSRKCRRNSEKVMCGLRNE